MDQYMHILFDFMDPESETEMLIRKSYDHIATFNPKEAKRGSTVWKITWNTR